MLIALLLVSIIVAVFVPWIIPLIIVGFCVLFFASQPGALPFGNALIIGLFSGLSIVGLGFLGFYLFRKYKDAETKRELEENRAIYNDLLKDYQKIEDHIYKDEDDKYVLYIEDVGLFETYDDYETAKDVLNSWIEVEAESSSAS